MSPIPSSKSEPGATTASNRLLWRRLSRIIPALAFALGLGLTVYVSNIIEASNLASAEDRFKTRTHRVVAAITTRMATYEPVLRGAVAFFNARQAVDREEWRDYVYGLHLSKNYPGLQGLGFTKLVSEEEKDDLIRQVQAEGFPEFAIWPKGDRPEFAPILYLEPFDRWNRRAFGHDMMSEPVRRTAIARARDTGASAITGKITLVSETEADAQSGFIMYLPLYREGMPTTTVADRRAALLGFVFSPFRMNNLMQRILGEDEMDLMLQIYDGTEISEDSLTFASGMPAPAPRYTRTVQMHVGGQVWTLKMASLPAFQARLNHGEKWYYLVAGIVISVLLGGALWSLMNTRADALRIAHETANALRRSESRFRGAFETAPHGMALVGLDGRWLMVNRALCGFLGYDAAELLKTDFAAVTHPDDLEADLENVRCMLDGEIASYQMEKRYIRKDGSEIPVLLSVALVRDDENNPLHFISQLLDLTDRKEAEKQLHYAQKMEAIGQLTGGVAHDFNNLLTVILGNSQLLERRVNDDEESHKRAKAISDSARRGAKSIQHMLAFSRRQVLEAKATDINELIGQVAEMLERTLGETIEIEISVTGDLDHAFVDASQLESVIVNLSINARDAMPDGGSLLIETANVVLNKGSIHGVTHLIPGEYVMIAISDTGIGIAKEHLGKLFEPFYTTKDVGKGTGLGLSMVYGFVKQSGGYIDVESEIGRGTTFRVYLPKAAPDDAEQPAKDIGDEDYPSGREKVLVVEDEAFVRNIAVSVLDSLGYDVLEASDGRNALSVLHDNSDVDLLFTDVVMPGGMSGFELAVEARQYRRDLKILYTSGNSEKAALGGPPGELLGELLPKPYVPATLARKIRSTLDG